MLVRQTAMCECAAGFSGRYCETERDECAEAGGSAACLHGGRCLDATGAYLCDCEGTGMFSGRYWETERDECKCVIFLSNTSNDL